MNTLYYILIALSISILMLAIVYALHHRRKRKFLDADRQFEIDKTAPWYDQL